MERKPLPAVDPDVFEFAQAECFCGLEADEVFRGWPLCRACAPGVKRQWRRQNPKPVKMATSLRTRR